MNHIEYKIYNIKSNAFTLVELMIVVAILGILAAVVLPEVNGHTQRAKEAAAKDNLRILRTAIERYAIDHNDTPPGYLNGDTSTEPSTGYFYKQLIQYGNYISEMPENPFNNLNGMVTIINGVDFPLTAPNISGWIYKPETKTIRLDRTGNDSNNIPYFDY